MAFSVTSKEPVTAFLFLECSYLCYFSCLALRIGNHKEFSFYSLEITYVLACDNESLLLLFLNIEKECLLTSLLLLLYNSGSFFYVDLRRMNELLLALTRNRIEENQKGESSKNTESSQEVKLNYFFCLASSSLPCYDLNFRHIEAMSWKAAKAVAPYFTPCPIVWLS